MIRWYSKAVRPRIGFARRGCEYPCISFARAALGRYAGDMGRTVGKQGDRRWLPWRRLRRRLSRERLRWAVRVRAIVIALFLGLAVAAWAAGMLVSLTPIVAAAAAGAMMNGVAALCVRHWRGIGPMILWSGAGDAVLITSVVWVTGGAHSPFLFLYALQVVTAALVLGVGIA